MYPDGWYHNGIPTLHRNCNVSEHGRTRGEASPGKADATFGIFLPFVLLCMHTSNHKNGVVGVGLIVIERCFRGWE
jgi:hypothetical protein